MDTDIAPDTHESVRVYENTLSTLHFLKSGMPQRSLPTRFFAVCVAALLLAGCQASSPQNARHNQEAPQTGKSDITAQAQIFEDEAMLKGSQAVIGGTVRNISESKFEGLDVEIELIRRRGGGTEARRVALTPSALAPGEEGRYALTVPSREWGNARILRLHSATLSADIVYRTAPGAKRPPERIADRQPTIVVVPRPKRQGEEFINTPDNPEKIP